MTSTDPQYAEKFAQAVMSCLGDDVDDDFQDKLDDLVYDWSCDANIDTGDEEDFSIIAEIRTAEASEINNGGPEEQIRTLLIWGIAPQTIIDLIGDHPTISAHARIELANLARENTLT